METNLNWQKADQWLPVNARAGREGDRCDGVITRDHRETLWGDI